MPERVTLTARDIVNADRLRRALRVKNRNTVVSSSLDVTANLADIMKSPGSKLYLKKGDGTVRRVFITKPRVPADG